MQTRDIITIGDEWPGGISDGLYLPCGVCGIHPAFDHTVSDEAWREVVPGPKDLRRGVVCLQCFDRLAHAAGVYTSDVLERVQFTGLGETIILSPIKVYRYAARSRR